MYVGIVPGIVGYLALQTDVSTAIALSRNATGSKLTRCNQGKYDLRGKRRGDTIAEF